MVATLILRAVELVRARRQAGVSLAPVEPPTVPRQRWAPVLNPPPALEVAVATSCVVAVVAALVWYTRWPDPVAAAIMRWQEVARVHADGVATAIGDAVGPLAVLAVVTGVALAWRAKRWDAVLLSLVAVPGALAVELVLKQVVHRQRPDGAALLFPLGHVAVATAAAVTVVLVAGAVSTSPWTGRVAWLLGWLVVVIAAARLVQTVHYLSDVVGGAATGLAVTYWAALAITAGCRSVLCRSG